MALALVPHCESTPGWWQWCRCSSYSHEKGLTAVPFCTSLLRLSLRRAVMRAANAGLARALGTWREHAHARRHATERERERAEFGEASDLAKEEAARPEDELATAQDGLAERRAALEALREEHERLENEKVSGLGLGTGKGRGNLRGNL